MKKLLRNNLLKTNFNLNSWKISQGDYKSNSDYEEAFKTATMKAKMFKKILLLLFFLCGTAIILLSSILVSKI
jgi:hypothetical protein